MKSASYSVAAAAMLACGVPGSAFAGESGETAVQLPGISVTGAVRSTSQVLQMEGKAADGYRIDTIQNVGPLGAFSLLDTPYSVSVVPQDLISNLQAAAPDQVFRIAPSTQLYLSNARDGQTDVTIRGFSDPAVAEDGLRGTVFRMDLEDKERVEIFSGLTGFLFGPANPGGMINYVLKRPTSYRLNSVTVGDTGGANGYIHGDFGGSLDADGRFGYRVNLLAQGGDGVADNWNLQRFLVSGAFDIHVTSDFLLQLDAAYSDYRSKGIPPVWIFVPGALHPKAPDNSKNWGQSYTSDDSPVTKLGANFTYRINGMFTWRSGVKYVEQDQRNSLLVNNLSVSTGTFIPLIFRNAGLDTKVNSAYSFLDVKFQTGFVDHSLTAGVFGDITKTLQPPDRNNTAAFPAVTFDQPTPIPQPDLPAGTLPKVESNYLQHTNFVVGDSMKIGESWSALAGLNLTRIIDEAWDYTTPGAPETASYNKSKLSPAVSLIYKPLGEVSTYVSYIQGLEEGGVAPNTAANAFQILSPLTSTQYEVGTKANIDQAQLSAALFRIERPNQFLDTADNVFKQDGQEVHQGFELTVTGKVLPDLTLWGGVTLMDARVADAQANPALSGKRPIGIGGVSNQLAKLYAEYSVDAVPGLFLTGGVYYNGPFFSDALNKEKLPGYALVDLGARYVTTLSGTPTAFRLNVTNVGGKDYWQSSQFLGTPRTVMFSVQTQF